MKNRANYPMHPGIGTNGFVSDLLADWAEHGREAIEIVRCWHPDRYLRLVAACLPKHPDTDPHRLADLTDEQVEAQLAEVLAELVKAGVDVLPGHMVRPLT